MSLHTAQCINSYQWEELPIDNYVIEQVEFLAKFENQPIMHNGYTHLELEKGEPIIDHRDYTFDANHPFFYVLNEEHPIEE